jgi:16S rRNA processing protein RimM
VPAPSELLEIGHITKPHGIRGEVIVRLTTDRRERLDVGSVLASDRGDLVVLASRPHQRDWIVAFDGVADRNQAETMRGLVLRAEPLDDPDALWVHDLVGSSRSTAPSAAR